MLQKDRVQAIRAINEALVITYWQIGRYVVEFEQAEKEKADYGKELLVQLSKDLVAKYGKGFSKSNLY